MGVEIVMVEQADRGRVVSSFVIFLTCLPCRWIGPTSAHRPEAFPSIFRNQNRPGAQFTPVDGLDSPR